MRLQPPSRAVAARFTCGCSLLHLRLQGMMLYGGLALLNARNAYAHTPLHVAVSRGAARAVRRVHNCFTPSVIPCSKQV